MKRLYIINIKRVYAKPQKNDGFRILVNCLWPRGVSKENTKVDLSLKDIAPSNKLRKWFRHDPKKWIRFQSKYRKELAKNKKAVTLLKDIIKKKEGRGLALFGF